MKKRQRTGRGAFAMTFSDLMMGATGVVIVMLLLLSVVLIRGFAESDASAEAAFPPGLREAFAKSDTSIRLVVEPGRSIQRMELRGSALEREEVTILDTSPRSSPAGPTLRHWLLPGGLRKGELQLIANAPLEDTFISLTVFIAGTSIPKSFDKVQVSAEDVGSPLILIGLQHPTIIKRP